jgi:hypothetical protein
VSFRHLGLAGLVCAVFANSAGAAPNVLNAGTHADVDIAPAVQAALGPGVVDSAIDVDYDPPASIAQALTDSLSTSATLYSVASSHAVNHAPYAVVNGSYCCSHGQGDDPTYYPSLSTTGQILSIGFALQVGGLLPTGTAPPTATTTASAPNSTNGGTWWGIEFGLSSSYFGLDTSADSWVSAEMAGFLAALKYEHPTWNWFDIKAALRQTASNWATGYSHTAYGYGFIAWIDANAIGSPSQLYLQPPGMRIVNNGSSLSGTLYPYRQTRRVNEVVYSVALSYQWPVKNEYTAADLSASGGTLIFTSDRTDHTPQFTYQATTTGTVNLVAFTNDGAGHYSRVEEFSVMSESVTAP